MNAVASTAAGRSRSLLPGIALCGMFLLSTLLAIPPYRPGLNWANANLLNGAVIYLSMAVLGAFCSLLAVALELGALHLGGGRPREVRFAELLKTTLPRASIPLAMMLPFLEQSVFALTPIVNTIGWSALACASSALSMRCYKARAASVGAKVRWKSALALLFPATALVMLFYFPLWVLAGALVADLIRLTR